MILVVDSASDVVGVLDGLGGASVVPESTAVVCVGGLSTMEVVCSAREVVG